MADTGTDTTTDTTTEAPTTGMQPSDAVWSALKGVLGASRDASRGASQTPAMPPAPDGLSDAIRALFPDASKNAVAATQAATPTYRAGTVQDTIVRAAQKHGVDPSVMLGLAQSESSFDPHAVSPTGATGLYQFTKSTAKQYGVDRNDPVSSADGAARYVKDLLAANGGDVAAALRSYKGVSVGGATEGNVQDTLKTIDKYRGGANGGANAGGTAYTAPANAPLQSSDGLPDKIDYSDLDAPGSTASSQVAAPAIDYGRIAGQVPEAPGAHLQMLLNNLGIQSSHGVGATGYVPAISTTPKSAIPDIAASDYTENVSRGSDVERDRALGGLEGLLSSVNRGLTLGANAMLKDQFGEGGIDLLKTGLGVIGAGDEKIASRIASRITSDKSGGPFAGDLVMSAGAQVLEGAVNTLTNARTLFPQTLDAIANATTTGYPAADEALQVAGGTAVFATPAAPIALGTSVGGTALNVATGKETPLAGAADLAVLGVGLKGFKAASQLQNIAKRIVGNVLVSEGMEVAGSAVHGETPTLQGAIGAAATGLAFGAAGGHGVEGAAEQVAEPSELSSADLKTKVDVAAHEAATSPLNDRPEPTPAQTEAGNYKKGHIAIHGLDLSIENPAGSVRSGTGADGEAWNVELKDHYGYIKGTIGADGDHLDAFIGPDPKSDKVFVVDQVRPAADVAAASGRTDAADVAATAPLFDEHKVILGAHTAEEATEIYKRNFSDDASSRIGAVTEASMPEFKEWIKNGDPSKPFAKTNERSTEPASEGLATNTAIDSDRPSAVEARAESGGARSDGGAPANPVAGEADRSGLAERTRTDAASADGDLPERSTVASESTDTAAERTSERKPIDLSKAVAGRKDYQMVDGVKVPVQYMAVEMRDVQLSHNLSYDDGLPAFSANDRYAGENQNAYDVPGSVAQDKVLGGVADTDWETIHSGTHTSDQGPTTIDRFGQAAGGNGRGLMQQGIEALRPGEGKDMAVRNADRFGLDPSKVARMEQPMIVRMQEGDVTQSVESRRRIAGMNATGTQERSPEADGVYSASMLTDKNKSVMAESLAKIDKLSELGESADKAAPIIRVLSEPGMPITKTNREQFVTADGALTQRGVRTVEGMSLGSVLPSTELIEKLPNGFRQKIFDTLPKLSEVQATPGWELDQNLKRIVDYNEARRNFIDKHKSSKEMFERQASLLPEADRPPELTSEDHTLLTLLEDPKSGGSTRAKFREFMETYAAKAQDARSGAIDLSGGEMTRDRAFTEAREALNIPERTGLLGYFDKTKAADDEYIRQSLNKLSAGLDPELMARMARRGAAWIAEGVHDFAEWSKRAVVEWGDRVTDDLREIYDGAHAQYLANKGESIGSTVRDLVGAYLKPAERTTFQRIIGTFRGAQQRLDHELNAFAKEIKAAIPDKARREAITNYIQADGRADLLTERAAKSSAKYAQGYLDAASLTPAEQDYAQQFRIRMEQTWQMAHDAGVLEGYVENYVRGEYERNPDGAKKILATYSSGGFNPNPKEAMHKLYQSYFDAEQAGLTPKDKDIGRQMIANERNLKMAIEARKMLASMMYSMEADGRPTVLLGGKDGRLGVMAEGQTYQKQIDGRAPKRLIDPHSPHFIRPNATGKDDVGYKHFDHPAFRKWIYLANDDAGKGIFLQSDMLLHPDATKRMQGLLGRSLISDNKFGQMALRAGSFVKGTVMIGPFHQFNLGVEAISHGDNPFTLPPIDFDKRDANGHQVLREGVEHGLMLVSHNAMGEFEGEGQSRGLLHKIPVVGGYLNRYQDYLFQDWMQRMKGRAYEHWVASAEERNAGKLLSGEYTRDKLLEDVANEVNASFGEQDYKYLGRNPTLQDAMRLAFLAPDFLESRVKHLGQAFTPHGHEQRMALLRGALMLSATAQFSNMLFSDDKSMHWDEPFTFRFGKTKYTPRSAAADALRAIPVGALIQDGITKAVSDAVGFWYYRLNPLFGRPLIEMLEGRNSFGEKVTVGEAALDILKSWTPIPAQGLLKQKPGDRMIGTAINALLGSVGISNTPVKTGLERFVSDRYFAKLPQEKRTATASELVDATGELREAYRTGASADNIQAIQQKYAITDKKAKAIEKQSKSSQLAYSFTKLSLEEMAEAFDKHTDDIRGLPAADRSKMQHAFLAKIKAANTKIEWSDEKKAMYRQKYNLGE